MAGDRDMVFQLVLDGFQHRRDAAVLMEHAHCVFPGGTQVAQVGHFPADPVEVFQGQVHMGLMGNGHQVQHRVGGSAQGHDGLHRIQQGRTGQDLIGGDAFFDHGHDPFAAGPGQSPFFGRDGGGSPHPGQGQSQHFGQAAHGVGRPHHGTGAHGGQGSHFHFPQFFIGHLAHLILAHEFPQVAQADVVIPVTVAGNHGAAGDDDGRDLHPGCGQDHPGDDLVAAGQHYHSIQLVALNHGFHRVRNDFPAGQGIPHAAVPLAQAIAQGDGVKFPGNAPGFQDAVAHIPGQFPQVDMAGYQFTEGIGDPDDGFPEIILFQSHAVQQSPVAAPADPIDHDSTAGILVMQFISAHGVLPQFILI